VSQLPLKNHPQILIHHRPMPQRIRGSGSCQREVPRARSKLRRRGDYSAKPGPPSASFKPLKRPCSRRGMRDARRGLRSLPSRWPRSVPPGALANFASNLVVLILPSSFEYDTYNYVHMATIQHDAWAALVNAPACSAHGLTVNALPLHPSVICHSLLVAI
jgi:hypothetical protein